MKSAFSFRSLPLAVALALLAYTVVPLVDKLTLKWFARDMDIRSQLISSTLQEPLVALVIDKERTRISNLLQKATQDERLLALGVCGNNHALLYKTAAFPKEISCKPTAEEQKEKNHLIRLSQGPVHLSRTSLHVENTVIGSLVLVHDMSFVERRSADTRKYVIILFVVLGVVISLITVFVAHLSWRGWMEGVRAMLRGEGILRPSANLPVRVAAAGGEMRAMLRNLETERRHADDMTTTWNPAALRRLLNKQLAGDQVLVVSNREPYIHGKTDQGIMVHRPASGLVTAVEPVMRACSGTWIAHGSGSADRETVDKHDRVGCRPKSRNTTCAGSG
jgi:trehalose 6-phosphate synthase